jgi:hypothetical protein
MAEADRTLYARPAFAKARPYSDLAGVGIPVIGLFGRIDLSEIWVHVCAKLVAPTTGRDARPRGGHDRGAGDAIRGGAHRRDGSHTPR